MSDDPYYETAKRMVEERPEHIADQLVERGILTRHGNMYGIGGKGLPLRAHDAVSDWRTVGECLIRMPVGWLMKRSGLTSRMEAERMLRDPLSIVKAFLEASDE